MSSIESRVCKFGGTSLANAERFQAVANLIAAEPSRRAVVVSAPQTGAWTRPTVKVLDGDFLLELAEDGAVEIARCLDAREERVGVTHLRSPSTSVRNAPCRRRTWGTSAQHWAWAIALLRR